MNDRWVLTAAHCEFSTYGDRIVVGAHFRSNTGNIEIFSAVENVPHEKAAKTMYGTWRFDFRLLKVYLYLSPDYTAFNPYYIAHDLY